MAEFLSICIPTYNRAQYLKRAVDSVLVDLVGNDIKLYVQDNASPDGTQGLMQTYMNNNIVYERNSENIGIVGNVNLLMKKAKGKYIIFLTDDDYFLPGGIRKIQDFLIKENPDFLSMDMFVYLEKTHKGMIDSALNKSGIVSEIQAVKIFMRSNTITRCCFFKEALSNWQHKEQEKNKYPHQVAIMDLLIHHKKFAYIAEPLVVHTWENELYWEKDFDKTTDFLQANVTADCCDAQLSILELAKKDLNSNVYNAFCRAFFLAGIMPLKVVPKQLKWSLRKKRIKINVKKYIKGVIHKVAMLFLG